MTPDDQYAANLQLLQARDATMAAQIAALPLTNLQLFPSRTGALSGAVWDVHHQGWVPLTSTEDPRAEAQRDAAQLYQPGARVTFLCGFGLGYFTQAFVAKMQPWQRLAIVETSPQLFKAALYAIDFAPLIAKNVHFIIGDSVRPAIEQWFLNFQVEDKLAIGPLMRGGYTSLSQKAEYDALTEYAGEFVRYHLIGLATWEQFGEDIGRNDLANLPEFVTVPGYNQLAGLWQGKPAVCIAAGPSLRKNLAALQDPAVRARVCVISVGTVYAVLQALDITPDIVCTIDFQRLNWTDQFQHVPLDPSVPLVYLHSTYPQTVRRWPGPRFLAVSGSDTTEWLKTFLLDEKAGAERTQTVAHLGLLVAYTLGASPILLLGQDLAHTAAEHHALGARAQDSTVAEAQDSFVQVPGYDGAPVWTRHSYLSMRTVFQQLLAAHPGQRVINCTEGGMPIDGAANRPFRDVLEEICLTTVPSGPTVAAQAADIARSYRPAWKAPDLHAALEQLAQHVDRIGTWCAEVAAFGTASDAATDAATRQAIGQQLLATEPTLQQFRPAVSLYCIRTFQSVRLMGEIPLTPEGQLRSGDDLAQYNVTRMRRLAEVFAPLHPRIAREVRLARRRLEALTGEQAPATWPRVAALQAYHTVRDLLQRTALCEGLAPAELALAAFVAHAQQQYGAALVLGEYTRRSPRKRHRMQQRLQAFAQTLGPIRAAYTSVPTREGPSHAQQSVPSAD